MYGHNRAWGHYFCPFLLVFMLTKMAFDGGKWLQCLSQSLTWPLGPGVFLRPVPSCTCGVSVLLQFYPSLCSESCWHFVFSYQKSKWSTWVAANCFVLFRLFVFASVVVCLPGFCLFLLFCFWCRMSNWLFPKWCVKLSFGTANGEPWTQLWWSSLRRSLTREYSLWTLVQERAAVAHSYRFSF